jgi:hypothetical protein
MDTPKLPDHRVSIHMDAFRVKNTAPKPSVIRRHKMDVGLRHSGRAELHEKCLWINKAVWFAILRLAGLHEDKCHFERTEAEEAVAALKKAKAPFSEDKGAMKSLAEVIDFLSHDRPVTLAGERFA